MSLVLHHHSELPFNRRHESSAIGTFKRAERAHAKALLKQSLKLIVAFAMMALVTAVAVGAKLAIWMPTYLH